MTSDGTNTYIWDRPNRLLIMGGYSHAYDDEGRRIYQKVNAEVFDFNTPSVRLHERLGFTLEGRLRRMIYTGGQFHDALIYGMTREEFESSGWDGLDQD